MSKQAKIIEVLVDDREKQPWNTTFFGPGFKVTRKRLKTGDYTIKGLSGLVAIERKRGWAEFYFNMTGNRRPRFFRFLARMSKMPLSFVLVEDDPSRMRLARINRGYIQPGFTFNAILEIMLQFGIPVIAIGKSRKVSAPVVRMLFRRIVEFRKDGSLYYRGGA